MKIGIDIDDTIVDTYRPMIKYADIYDIKVLGNTGTNNNLGNIEDGRYLEVLYNWDRKTKFDYFDKYYKNVLEECLILPDVSNIIQKLKLDGNEIIFISARVSGIKDCDTKNLTKKTLQDNNIPYDGLITDADDKLKYCIEHNIKFFIDDSYTTCRKLQENGIKSYLMTTIMNENVKCENVERVLNWKETYEKINKCISEGENYGF